MAITVRSDVADDVQAPDVTSQITPKLKPIIDHLEPAYRIEPGGAFEESAKGNASIFILFPLMVMVMLTLLMIQLQSFSRLILVFLTAPLGIVGNVVGSCLPDVLRAFNSETLATHFLACDALRPKNTHPFHFVPVISRATEDNDL
jgi:multidrug efflux pump subunit AcrB